LRAAQPRGDPATAARDRPDVILPSLRASWEARKYGHRGWIATALSRLATMVVSARRNERV
jgi:hypothetical protein